MGQSSGAVCKPRWTSWAPVSNKPMVSVDVSNTQPTNTCVVGWLYLLNAVVSEAVPVGTEILEVGEEGDCT